MARIILNSFLQEALGDKASALAPNTCLELPVTSVRGLLAMLEEQYPGSRQALNQAAIAIDGEIYNNALAEPLNDSNELVFIPAIEGG